MAKTLTANALLDTIERAALDPDSDITSVLRQCVAFGSRMNAPALTEWALKELKGYDSGQLPPYRVIPAPLLMDCASMAWRKSDAPVPFGLIDDDLDVKEEVQYGPPLATAEEAIRNAKARGEQTLRLSIPGSDHLVTLMNYRLQEAGNPFSVERVFWAVNISSMARVADVVRTTVIELVSKIRLEVGQREVAAEPDAVDRVSSHVLKGFINVNRVVNQTITGSAGDVNMVANKSTVGGPERQGWLKQWMYWLAGGATIVAAVPIVIAWLH